MEPNVSATTSETVENTTPTATTPDSTATSPTDGTPTVEHAHTLSAQPPNTATPTPEDISKLVTRESRKQLESMLKNAGIEPDGNPEMKLKDYKKYLDSQKSDLEEAQGSVTALTAERDAALAQMKSMERRMAAIAKGVPGDKADQYVVLAGTYLGEDSDFDKAMDAAIAAFPVAPVKPTPPQKAGTHIGGDSDKPRPVPPRII